MENKMESDIESMIRGFPKLESYHFGVHILRITIFWDLYWGLPFMATTFLILYPAPYRFQAWGGRLPCLILESPESA